MKTVKKKAVKGATVTSVNKRRISKRMLGSMLAAEIKAKSGRTDLGFEKAPEFATKTIKNVSLEERAGYPLKLTKGAVDPKLWRTRDGVQVEVDFGRSHWMPDDWGQGIKPTKQIYRSKKGGNGGILPCYVSPGGKTIYYHKHKVEEYVGRKLTEKDGLNGQIKLGQVQAEQQVLAARAQIKEEGSTSSYIGAAKDKEFFKLLTPRERQALPSVSDFHFCVISGRRASKLEGIRDIYTVHRQFKDAGVTETWYVDAESVQDYKKLGLKVVVGGKLTEARNKALDDAAKLGKICVQASDDISAWVYREGPNAKDRTDDALNAAHNAAVRYIVTPVAAARFILAKMRGVEGKQPKLGGVYPLGSCSRTFAGDAFARRHFIIGDFFVADKSKVRFDRNMKLKEDYDFACAHIQAHGSVMRCQRMTLSVKHYTNGGGAVTYRKAAEERRNIAILKKKWPGRFRDNPKRKNEVIMRWPKSAGAADNDADVEDESEDDANVDTGAKGRSKKVSSNTATKAVPKVAKVKKTALKKKKCSTRGRAG